MVKRLFIILFTILVGSSLIACSKDCSYFNRLTNSQCREAPITVSKSKPEQSSSTTDFTVNCANAPNAKKVKINCPAGSATFCNASSNGSGIYITLLPLTDQTSTGGGYVYVDPVTGTTLNNCNDLWNTALGSGTPLYGITAVFAIAQGGTTNVSCTDASGCTFTSTTCFTSWDSANQAPGNSAAAIPASGQYLTCAFIDSISAGGGLGVPPVGNNPSNTGSLGFGGINISQGNGVNEVDTISNTTITFSNWVDYSPAPPSSPVSASSPPPSLTLTSDSKKM